MNKRNRMLADQTVCHRCGHTRAMHRQHVGRCEHRDRDEEKWWESHRCECEDFVEEFLRAADFKRLDRIKDPVKWCAEAVMLIELRGGAGTTVHSVALYHLEKEKAIAAGKFFEPLPHNWEMEHTKTWEAKQRSRSPMAYERERWDNNPLEQHWHRRYRATEVKVNEA